MIKNNKANKEKIESQNAYTTEESTTQHTTHNDMKPY